MKKLALTIAIVLGMSVTTFAESSGLFQRGAEDSNRTFGNRDGSGIVLPGEHGQGENSDAPLGSGVVALLGLGAAYLVGKKRSED